MNASSWRNLTRSWARSLRLRLRTLFRGGRVEQELTEEFQYHLDRTIDEYVASGMPVSAARSQALRDMGAIDQRKEQCRDVSGLTMVYALRQDLIYALRGLAHTPGFTTAAVLTLALGIGATTAVFSVVNTVLLEPLPYKDADQLVRVVERAAPRGPNGPVARRITMTWAELGQWRQSSSTLSDQKPAPQLFVDYRQMLALTQARNLPTLVQERLAFGFYSFVVRTDRDPEILSPAVRSLIVRLDPAAGIDAMRPLEELVRASLTRQRFYALLPGIFAVIATVLGAVGIYGVLAYAVGQRIQEFGVRLALGAQPRDILRLVLRRGILLTALGIVIGVAGAMALSRYLRSMLFELTPLDPTTYLIVTFLFAAVALVAAYLPTRRATRIDPAVALRSE